MFNESLSTKDNIERLLINAEMKHMPSMSLVNTIGLFVNITSTSISFFLARKLS